MRAVGMRVMEFCRVWFGVGDNNLSGPLAGTA